MLDAVRVRVTSTVGLEHWLLVGLVVPVRGAATWCELVSSHVVLQTIEISMPTAIACVRPLLLRDVFLHMM